MDYLDFEKKIIDTLNKHAPKKIKTFRRNQKPHINETLSKAIMKRWQLKNKANKTRNVTHGSHYTEQRNYVVKLYNQSKKDYFDRVNAKNDSGESKIALSENCEFLTETNKLQKRLTCFLRHLLIDLIYLVGL